MLRVEAIFRIPTSYFRFPLSHIVHRSFSEGVYLFQINNAINQQTKITSKAPGIRHSISELWRFRGLLYTFAYRDYRARYAQTLVGFGWAILQPIISLLVLFVLFQRVLQTNTQSISFFPYALSGLIFWTYFNFVVGQAASSLINAQRMLQKIYFPRPILPLSKGLVGLVEAAVALLIFIVFASAESGFRPSGLLLWPFLLAAVMCAAWGLGLWFSALSIRYRDLQQVVPFLLQLLFFLTPVAYAPEMLVNILSPETYWLAYLNPITGIIEIFRAAVFDLTFSSNSFISLGVAMLLLLSGWWYFNRVERKMADLI